MKTFLVSAAALVLFLPTSLGCAEGIIPSFHFKNIAENPNVDEETRTWANATYWHTEELSHRRVSAPMGEGIATGDDDSEFDDEQDPAEVAALADEEAALLNADSESPQPSPLPPPTPGPTASPQRKHRRRGSSRTSPRAATPDRYVYDDYNQVCNKAPPYKLIRKEGEQDSSSQEINTVYTGLGDVFNLYQQVYGRNSIDGKGGRMHGTAGYCRNYGNAIWDGVQMLFGHGDGRVFNYGGFVRSLSVIGHEITHGVIQNDNPLKYYGQSGALNEHIADVFGILTEQYKDKQQASQSDWLIGKGIIVGGGAIRSMKAPGTAYNTPALGKDPQPATMANFFQGGDDNAGVHINSGIPNHAFYLFSTAVGGYAYDTPGKVWYNVLTRGQGQFNYSGETFATFAQRTVKAANQLYGQQTADQLTNAWKQVGVST